jgi:hypothetical protein
MGVYYDKRAKTKKWLAYHYDKMMKIKLTLGTFDNEQDANDAVKRYIESIGKESIVGEIVPEKKKISLNFGVWK